MKKHVILLADLDDEFASDLIDALRSGGMVVSSYEYSVGLEFHHELSMAESHDSPPIAIICQLSQPAHLTKLRDIVERARELWPNTPLVACPHHHFPRGFRAVKQLTSAGFRAVAESPAQLPVLLREVEDNPGTDDVPATFKPAQPLNVLSLLPGSMTKQRLRDAFDLIASLHLASNQKEAAALAVEHIARMAAADRWSIFVTDRNSTRDDIELELLATRPVVDQPTEVRKDAPPADRNLTVSIVPTKLAQKAVARVESLRKASGDNWLLALPLVYGERVYGVLEGIRLRPDARSFSRSEVATLNAMTTFIGAALSNSVRVAEAERLSLTDELTRLHNARYLRQFLVNEIKRARRFGSKIAALFIDLDDFKTINDLHGHLAGSHTLMEVASVILPSVRDTDCVVRYGGDEFVVILPETTSYEAVRVADRIRGKIERHRFTGGRRLEIHLTSSFGVAVFPDDANSPHQLIACADRAMYAAKAASKNCVRVATPADAPPLEAGAVEDPLDGPQFQRIPDEKFIS
jgi:diguanylate cyclase (GGDEF)-like protein